jgi:hypothetical protein
MFILHMLWLRGVRLFFLENPFSSAFFMMPMVLAAFEQFKFRIADSCMCSHENPSKAAFSYPQKRLRLAGTADWTIAIGSICTHSGNAKFHTNQQNNVKDWDRLVWKT